MSFREKLQSGATSKANLGRFTNLIHLLERPTGKSSANSDGLFFHGTCLLQRTILPLLKRKIRSSCYSRGVQDEREVSLLSDKFLSGVAMFPSIFSLSLSLLLCAVRIPACLLALETVAPVDVWGYRLQAQPTQAAAVPSHWPTLQGE